MPGEAPAGFLSLADAARVLEVTPMTLWRRIHAGELAVYEDQRDRRRHLIAWADVSRILAPRAGAPSPRRRLPVAPS